MFKALWHRIQVLLRWISIWITRIVRFVTHDIWFLNEADSSRWKGRLVRDAKTIILMVNTFSVQKIGYQITALAFRSLLAVVPAIAIGLYLTDWLGLKETYAYALQNYLGEERIVEGILNAADNIVRTAESGLFGFISMASFTWIVLSLMFTVRRVFNNVWKVEKEQRFLKTLGVVLGITLLAPFVVMLFFSGSVMYSHILDYIFPSTVFFFDHIKRFLSWIIFGGISILVLSAMYKYIPGTKVHYRPALKAAIISGIGFTAVQFLYVETQVMVAKQSAVYGILAAIPLLMIWLNMGWSIILYGAELSYAFQNVDRHQMSVETLDKMNEEAITSRKKNFQKKMSI